jgi:hypothetical protein
MINRAMQAKLDAARAIDVSRCRRTAAGDYVLESFTEGRDYCDSAAEAWIWSIGKTLRPLTLVMADGERILFAAGTYLAATNSRHYSAGESATIECVWLR